MANRSVARWISVVAALCAAQFAGAATPWSEATHQLAFGDFDGDGKQDVLYIAKDAGLPSGIARSDGSSPSINHQSWASNYLGIPWHSGTYKAFVADFNGDTRADILLQRQSQGDHYLLFANSSGQITAINQTLAYNQGGQIWSPDAHRLVVGDYNGDGKRDVFLQSVQPAGLNAVFLASSAGQFSSAQQTWGNSHMGFRWSLRNAVVHAGDFNGDGKSDLFVQAKPDFVIIDYDVPFPVPTYRAGSFGIANAKAANAGGEIFYSPALQIWDRNYLGVDWSAANYDVIVGNFDGDATNRDDILLQGLRSGSQNRLLIAGSGGQFNTGNSLSGSSALASMTADQYRLHSVRFGTSGARGIYAQAKSASGTNQVLASVSAVSSAPHDPNAMNIVTPGTAVGSIPGTFAVDPNGGATYQIPIVVSPGVARVQPVLSLVYSSRAGNGTLGVGWQLSGVSAITRCPTTVAQDGLGNQDGADLDANDAYCLDGQRLIAVSGANGAPNARYRTEIESLQDVASSGSNAGNPDSFTVRDNNGLTRYYGSVAGGAEDSRFEARRGSVVGPVAVWAIKLITDRFNNFVEYRYEQEANTLEFRPAEITYGSQYSSPSSKTIVGRVVLEYTGRDDAREGYAPGGYKFSLTKRLQKISTFGRANPTIPGANDRVSQYYFNYEYSPTTTLSHLTSIVLCDGGAGATQRCLNSSKFAWQHGYRGFSSSSVATNVDLGSTVDLKMFDADGDGRNDYVYRHTSGNNTGQWLVRYASLVNSKGSSGSYVQTGITVKQPNRAFPIDWNSDGYTDLVDSTTTVGSAPYAGNYKVWLGGPNGLSSSNSIQGSAAEGLTNKGLSTVVGDFDGDGRQDIAYSTAALGVLKVHLNNAANPASGLSAGSLLTGYINPVMPAPDRDPGVDDDDFQYASPVAFEGNGTFKAEPALYVLDFDGDRKDDLLMRVQACYRRLNEFQQYINVCVPEYHVYSIVNGVIERVWGIGAGSWGVNPGFDQKYLKLADFNGDGLTDILSYGAGFASGYGAAWNLSLGTGSKGVGTEAFYTAMAASSNSATERCDDLDYSVFNIGLPSASCLLGITVQLTPELLDSTMPVDYNRDGYADLLFANAGYWQILLGGPNGYRSKVLSTGREARQPKLATLVDDAGDGLPDILFPWGGQPEHNWHVYYGRGPAVSGVIETITDGLGAQTQIQYAVTTASTDTTNYTGTVYKGHTRFPEDPASATLTGFRTVQALGWPNAHLAGAIPVVYQYSADNGIGTPGSAGGGIRTTLQYWGLKMNRQGRGQLGFSEVRAWNDNSEIETRTRYAQQTFPLIGSVLTFEQRFRDQSTYSSSLSAGPDASSLYFDYVAACETNRLCLNINPQPNTAYSENSAYTRVSYKTHVLGARAVPGTASNVYVRYVRKTVEETHPVSNGNAGPNPHKRVVTEVLANSSSTADSELASNTNPVDQYGNPGAMRVTTTNGGAGDALARDEHIVLTTGTFTNNTTAWCLSQLTSSTIVNTKPSTNTAGNGHALNSVTRTASFTYGAGGSPCALASETDDAGVTKTFGYDAFGNVESQTLSYSGMPANQGRTTTSSYAATQGQFPTEIRNSLGHLKASVWDGRFGVATAVTGPNGITSTTQLDTFGRKLRETPISALPAAYSEASFYWCANTGMCWDSRSVYTLKASSTDGASTFTEYDRLGRPINTHKVGFDGNWVASEVYFDPLGRSYLSSRPYKPALQSTRCWDFRSYDQLNRVIATWSSYSTSECTATILPFNAVPTGGRQTQTTYDLISASGNTTKVVGNSSDTSTYATTRVSYSTINVLGRTRFVRSELAAAGCPSNGTAISSNSTGCLQTEYDYDAQGNLTYTKQVGGLGVATATPSTTIESKAWFDSLGRKSRMLDPDLGNRYFTYTPFGELDTQTDAKGQITDLDYDRLGRVVARVEKLSASSTETTTTFAFDSAPMGIGKLATVTASNGYSESMSYDSLGRFARARRQIDGSYYYVDQTYDGLGRPDVLKYPGSIAGDTSSAPEADSNRVRVRNNYNGYGFLASVQDVATGTTYWRADAVDEHGAVTQETLGNGLVTKRFYDRATGYLGTLKTGTAANDSGVQNLEVGFDQAANLRIRKDLTTGVNGGSGIREEYDYDKLYRLTRVRQYKPASSTGPAATTDNLSYDDFGNLLAKGTSYTNYCYVALGGANDPCAGVTAQMPHATKRITTGSTSRDYGFDLNGNVTSATGGLYDTVSWYVSNLPKRISKGSKYAEFTYAADRSRVKQLLYRNASDTETTIYVGALYEKLTKSVGGVTTVEHTHYIVVGGNTVTLAKRTGTSAIWSRYPHRDHLGSIVALTNDSGALVERSAYDPWGKRTSYATWDAVTPGTFTAGGTGTGGLTTGMLSTKRGFTSHEHVEELGFVHMNGRIYDNESGRFFSADPFIQFPLSTQGFNRYAYVGNNPLSYSDPSGFYVDKGALGKLLYTIGEILTNFGGWWKAAGYALMAVGGYLQNGGNTEAWLSWLSNSIPKYTVNFGGAPSQSGTFAGTPPPDQSGGLPEGAMSLNGENEEPAGDDGQSIWSWLWEWSNPFRLIPYERLVPSHDSFVSGTNRLMNGGLYTGRSYYTEDPANALMVEKTATMFETTAYAVAEVGKEYPREILLMAATGEAGELIAVAMFGRAGTGGAEVYFRTMSQAHYEELLATGRISATRETFISPSAEYAGGYNGVTVQFNVRAGTTDSLLSMGVRNAGLNGAPYGNLPLVQSGWGSSSAFFKLEGNVVNIGLGRGRALNTFNENIVNFSRCTRP